ncbi:17757_t:CDS:2 [Cetraspora pellucida]|uniref:17757_t:CDS:1 n=1 Tax=Cetraspora pellucida TaxID=1433469 RepID=A0A9N9BPD7_9GLOM|nr:17757_t:CDS:2 [Cetraspora pellucida]
MSLINRIFPSLAQDLKLLELEPFFSPTSRITRTSNFPSASSVLSGYFRPSVDVSETDKNYIIEAEVPGMKKDDLSVEFVDNTLTLKGKVERFNVRGDDQLRTVDTTQSSGETKPANTTTSDVVESDRESASVAEPTYWTSERVLGSFQRSFTLPNNADKDNVKAQYKDGILSITIPKKYQKFLDEVTPYVTYRWIATTLLGLLFMIRIISVQGFYIALGIYLLNLFLAFLQPKFDPSLEMDIAESEVEEGPSLPTKADEEFRPFIRRLPEFKFW